MKSNLQTSFAGTCHRPLMTVWTGELYIDAFSCTITYRHELTHQNLPLSAIPQEPRNAQGRTTNLCLDRSDVTGCYSGRYVPIPILTHGWARKSYMTGMTSQYTFESITSVSARRVLPMHMIATEKMGECSTLPLYTPSGPSPKYSCDPVSGETTLQQTPGINRVPPTGAYYKKSGKVSVTLFEQDNDAEIPTYGRHGLINGVVHLENHELISQVVLKIKGKLELTSSEGGAESIELVNDSYRLWSGRPEDATCPTLIPFSCVLPLTFKHRDSTYHPLPPSYVLHPTSSISSFFVQSDYSIHVCIERARHRKVGFLTKSKRVRIPFKYYPRTRAHRPIVSSPSFFSTIKTSPEEWHQCSSSLRIRSELSRLDPIQIHLFIPAARVYSVADEIPFHLQLNGPLGSFQNFLVPTSHSNEIIKVVLLRKVAIGTGNYGSSRSIVLAEGNLSEIPPLAFSPCEPRDSMHLDWEGAVRCGNDTSVGSFTAGNVSVKDFVVLDIRPAKHGIDLSPFLTLQLLVPIKLVTDSYLEETDYAI